MRNLLVAVCLATLTACGVAQADPPQPVSSWERYVRVGAPRWGHDVALTANTQRAVLNDTGTYTDERDLQLFTWGTIVSISCTAVACACLALDDTDALTMGVGATCGDLADAGAPGDASATAGSSAPCMRVEAGARRDIMFSRAIWPSGLMVAASPAGYRSGYCSQTTGNTYFPCDTTADCLTSAGATGTCTEGYPDLIRGGFVLMEAATTTNCFVGEEI